MESLQQYVIRDFIKLTERIANGKNNLLQLGGGEMSFYRGEIHMIQMIGDEPGIFISEMARAFHITRAVVAKTVRKLEERGYVMKQEDEEDRKRLRLYLTGQGQRAYDLHRQYHLEVDRPMFEFLEGLDDRELELLRLFLQHAGTLVGNHF